MMLLIFESTRTREEISKLVHRTSFIPLLSKSLEYFATCPHQNPCVLQSLLDPLSNLLHPTDLLQRTEPPTSSLELVKRSLKKHWQPALRRLRRLPKDVYPSRNMVIDEWVKFGRGVPLRENRDYSSLPDEEIATEIVHKRCFDEGCLCYEKASAHSMRVCRGCWRVTYCNKMCQRRHWQAGHRQVCHRRT